MNALQYNHTARRKIVKKNRRRVGQQHVSFPSMWLKAHPAHGEICYYDIVEKVVCPAGSEQDYSSKRSTLQEKRLLCISLQITLSLKGCLWFCWKSLTGCFQNTLQFQDLIFPLQNLNSANIAPTKFQKKGYTIITTAFQFAP